MRIDDPMLVDWLDFWSSDDVEVMDDRQVVAYLRLISLQWRDGDLPADPRRLAAKISNGSRPCSSTDLVGDGDLLGPSPGSIWEALMPCYEATLDESSSHPLATLDDSSRVASGRLRNVRVYEDREAWIAKKERWKVAGKKGGSSKRKRRKPPISSTRKTPFSHPLATLDDSSTIRQRSATPSPSPSSPSKEEKSPPTPRQRGRRIPSVTIPPELIKIGITAESFEERVRLCKVTKKPEAWQKEIDRLYKLTIGENIPAVIVFEVWEDAVTSGWQGCTPTMVRERAAKARGGNGQRQPPQRRQPHAVNRPPVVLEPYVDEPPEKIP